MASPFIEGIWSIAVECQAANFWWSLRRNAIVSRYLFCYSESSKFPVRYKPTSLKVSRTRLCCTLGEHPFAGQNTRGIDQDLREFRKVCARPESLQRPIPQFSRSFRSQLIGRDEIEYSLWFSPTNSIKSIKAKYPFTANYSAMSSSR